MKNLEEMKNNIIFQIYNDEKIVDKKELFDYVKELYNEHINSINCDNDQYKNVEDNRFLDEKKIIKANEIGYTIDGKEHCRVGSCIRNTFFNINNSIGLPISSSEIDLYERNQLIKKQFIDKLKFVQIYEEPKNIIVSQKNLSIQSTEDGFIYDAKKNNIYALLIKPINDSAFAVKNVLAPTYENLKSDLMPVHIPEIIVNMLILQKPIKIVYIGKNNPDFIVSFDCGINKQKLTVNNERREYLDISYVSTDMKELNHALETNIVPPRKYKNIILSKEEAVEMFELKMITNRELNDIINLKESYLDFHCTNCKYKNICDSISEGWSKL